MRALVDVSYVLIYTCTHIHLSLSLSLSLSLLENKNQRRERSEETEKERKAATEEREGDHLRKGETPESVALGFSVPTDW